MLLSFFQRLGRPFRTMRPGRLIVLVFLFIILLGAVFCACPPHRAPARGRRF